MTRPTAIVSGMVAGDPGQGGATWAVLQYALGLEQLGFEVALIEPILGVSEVPLASTEAARYLDSAVRPWLAGPLAILRLSTGESYGLDRADIEALAARARVLLNVSGMLPIETPFDRIPIRAYVDLDPAFNQLWHEAGGIDVHFSGHTHHATVGGLLGQPECPTPTCGIDWIPTLPPVVLAHWPVATSTTLDAFTTVGNWRSYGSIEHDGIFYGQRAHSTRELLPLAGRSIKRIAAALSIHADEAADLAALDEAGWELQDPAVVASDPIRYRDFVSGSYAELSIAKAGYVAARCGWVSDRSACYLASGRPVLAQDTGFGAVLPVGRGLLSYSTVEEAEEGIAAIAADYDAHRAAARELAERYLASGPVLRSLLSRLDAL